MRKIIAFILLALFIVLGGCEDAQALKADETKQKLVGSWLRAIERGGNKGSRLLVLKPDGKFDETLVVYFADGRKGRETKAGEWSFDGINLKRKYTHEDGRQLSGNFNFATFALTSLTGSEGWEREGCQGDIAGTFRGKQIAVVYSAELPHERNPDLAVVLKLLDLGRIEDISKVARDHLVELLGCPGMVPKPAPANWISHVVSGLT